MRVVLAHIHPLCASFPSWRTFACSSADGASQGHVFLSCTAVEQVAAVIAEDERADC
jgi:hypothetical protein